VLTGLTRLYVWHMTGLSPDSSPLKLPGLQHLELQHLDLQQLELFGHVVDVIMPMSYLASCTHLQHLKLHSFGLKGPGSLFASTMLQHLELDGCSIMAADGAADPASWQQVFPGPGQLPHLTSLHLFSEWPTLQQADLEDVVACCSNLQALVRVTLPSSFAPALARLPGLTSLQVHVADDEECSAMAQLTGLRQLVVNAPWRVSVVGLRQIAALQQLTSLGLGDFRCNRLDTLAQHLMKDTLPDCVRALVNKVCVCG